METDHKQDSLNTLTEMKKIQIFFQKIILYEYRIVADSEFYRAGHQTKDCIN